MLVQNFWAVNKVYYGRWANGESENNAPKSVKEPEIHGLFGEFRRSMNRGERGVISGNFSLATRLVSYIFSVF